MDIDVGLGQKLMQKYPDKIRYPYDEIIDVIGIEAYVALTQYSGGMSIYVAPMRYILKEALSIEIRQEFDGGNHKQLAQKYRFCERTIFKIIQEGRK